MEPIAFVAGALGILALVAAALYSATVVALSRNGVATLHDALEAEQLRVTELLHLLEAKAAPVEYAAYMDSTPSVVEPDPRRVYSEDGLMVTDFSDFPEAPNETE